MKNKILIINYCLQLAGAEKYVFEICKFAKENNIKPYVLIPNSLKKEYYDDIFKQYDIKVIRVNIMGLKTSLKKLQLKTLYWNLIIRYFLNINFKSIHLINLVIADRYKHNFKHKKRYFWHITNKVQYPDSKYNFDPILFSNKNDTIIYCNDYQKTEIHSQYNDIKCKELKFKLFLYD